MRNRTPYRKPYLVALVAAVALAIAAAAFTSPVKAETAQPAGSNIANPQPRQATPLRIDSVVRRGEMVEVKGHPDPAADVTVNGNPVPFIAKDGSFSFFFRTAAKGKRASITVVAQTNGKEPQTVTVEATD